MELAGERVAARLLDRVSLGLADVGRDAPQLRGALRAC
jgi:transposase